MCFQSVTVGYVQANGVFKTYKKKHFLFHLNWFFLEKESSKIKTAIFFFLNSRI